MKSPEWKTYRTRFLVQAKQLSSALSFKDHLGRQHCGRKGDYLVESFDGVLSIAPRQIFEDIYVPLLSGETSGELSAEDSRSDATRSDSTCSDSNASPASHQLNFDRLSFEPLKLQNLKMQRTRKSKLPSSRAHDLGTGALRSDALRMNDLRASDMQTGDLRNQPAVREDELPRARRKSPQPVRATASRLNLM